MFWGVLLFGLARFSQVMVLGTRLRRVCS
jgi:hypothetical protein